jgi:hypothetical protein
MKGISYMAAHFIRRRLEEEGKRVVVQVRIELETEEVHRRRDAGGVAEKAQTLCAASASLRRLCGGE